MTQPCTTKSPINPFPWLSPRIVQYYSPAMKMPQNRLPILHNLVPNNLVRISILLTKMKKPMIPKLLFLRKSRKLKRFKLLKHYNYGFLGEYQFDSPSSTPPIHYYNRKQPKRRSIQDIYSMLFSCKCFGWPKSQARGEADCRLALEAVPAPIGGELISEALDMEDDQEDSVNKRAEKFIERFYAEMRLQRQESFLGIQEHS